MSAVQNKGTGAGGANTNVNGKAFEEKTDNEERLIKAGFVKKPIPGNKGKNAYYLEKVEDGRTVVFIKQAGLGNYFMHFHKMKLFRNPDEAYLITQGGVSTLKILEKKNQNTSGSVEDKLRLGSYFKNVEYPGMLGDGFRVEYAFCLSKFLKEIYVSNTMKSKILREDNIKNSIPVFFGEDDDYFNNVDSWLNQ